MIKLAEIKVIYEDKDFVFLDKPSGLISHSAPYGGSEVKEVTLADFILKQYPETGEVGDDPKLRPGIVHRLDRDTSGIMVVARNQKAFDFLKNLFQSGKVKKNYKALALGKVKEKSGFISKPIGIKNGSVLRTVHVKNARMVKPAETLYKTIELFCFKKNVFTLLEVKPLTGRTHQIRVHLASIGHPVLGDKLYGGKNQLLVAKEIGMKRQFLHAESIEFDSLDGARLKISADLPKDLLQALSLLLPCRPD